jgi:predicted PP-loop superfamily ATPase
MELHFSKILNGWKNYIDKSEVVEKVAEQRAEICGRCPFAEEKLLLIFVKDNFKEVEGMACNRCECPLSMKIRSINEKCPENLW